MPLMAVRLNKKIVALVLFSESGLEIQPATSPRPDPTEVLSRTANMSFDFSCPVIEKSLVLFSSESLQFCNLKPERLSGIQEGK